MATDSTTLAGASALIDRVANVLTGNLSSEGLRAVLAIELTAEDQSRLQTLSAKAREGKLNAEEAQELDSYLHTGQVLSLLQSKARKVLHDGSGAGF
jgi:hypothetical protein